MTELRQKSFHALLWNAGGTYYAQASAFICAAVLGRLLTPEDFGIVSLVLTLNAFLVLFANVGLTTTIVQHRDLQRNDMRALVGLSLSLGGGCAVLLVAVAPLVANIFHDTRLIGVTAAIAPSLIFTALNQVPFGQLQRDLRFKEVALVTVSSSTLSVLAATSAAFVGAGYWSLVLQVLSRSGFQYLISAWLARGGGRPSWDPALYKRILGFTGNLTVFQIVNYMHRNLDKLLIGRVLGMAQLGFYTRSYVLLTTFNQALGGVIDPVLHSALARKQDDLGAMRRAYGEVLSCVLWVSAPVMAVLVVFDDEVIRLVWGPGWDAAVAPFFWLALAGMHQATFSTFGSVFAATNNTRTLLACGTITTAVFVTAVLVGLKGGILGVAQLYSWSSHLVFFPLVIFIWMSILQGRLGQLLRILLPPLVSSWLLVLLLRLVPQWRGASWLDDGLPKFAIVGFFMLYSGWRSWVRVAPMLRIVLTRSSKPSI